MSDISSSYYDILEIPPSASQVEIKQAYRRLALLHHPDRNPSASSKERFQRIGEAYACLSDVHQRELYDWDLRTNRAANKGGRGTGGEQRTAHQASQSSPKAAAAAKAKAKANSMPYARRNQQPQHPNTSNTTQSQARRNHLHHRQSDPLAQFDSMFQTDRFARVLRKGGGAQSSHLSSPSPRATTAAAKAAANFRPLKYYF